MVIDDDEKITSMLRRSLVFEGYGVETANDGQEGLKKILQQDPDLIILDVMMPKVDGWEVCRRIRESAMNTPILMLTARSEISDRIDGLEAGADDYLSKPFDPRELLLRVNNILKRGGTTPVQKVENVRFGPFHFSLSRRELKRGGDLVRLTDREQEIMAQFANKAGETIARQDLIGSETEVGERAVDVQINRLRRKIESDPANPLWLQTVRGIGYRLNVD